MAGAAEPEYFQNRITEVSDVECHAKWLPLCQVADSKIISKQRQSLQFKMKSEPWLRELHCVSLAHLSFVEGNKEECENLLQRGAQKAAGKKKSKKDQNPPKGIGFLIAAMRLHLTLKFHQSEEAELHSQLSDLDKMWQKEPVRAAVWSIKGWTMLHFEDRKTADSLAAFREALKLEAASASTRFLSLYGTASAMIRRGRKADLSAEIGQDKLELWEEAHQILEKQEQMHPVFLAEYAEAIAYTAVHSKRCEELAMRAFEEAKKFSGFCQVYVILPKVFRALKEWQNPAEVQRLSIKEKEVLDAGEKLYLTVTDETIRSDFAFQFALYYIKTKFTFADQADKERYKNALFWLDKVDASNIWARMRRLSVKESLLVLENSKVTAEYRLIQTEYENLLNDESIFNYVREQIRFEFGRFLLVILAKTNIKLIENQAAKGCKYMRDAIDKLPSVRFISKYKREQILATTNASDKDWFSVKLSSDYVNSSRFPMCLYNAHYEWRLGCFPCTSAQTNGSYNVTKTAVDHDCTESMLLVKRDTEDNWQHIRSKCERGEEALNAHENRLSDLEEKRQFDLSKFLTQVRQRRS